MMVPMTPVKAPHRKKMRSTAPSVSGVVAFFGRLGHSIGVHYNPADYILEVVAKGEGEPERAHGHTYCVATHVRTENGSRSKVDMYIRYLDELIKENGEWVFVKRDLDVGLHDVAVLG